MREVEKKAPKARKFRRIKETLSVKRERFSLLNVGDCVGDCPAVFVNDEVDIVVGSFARNRAGCAFLLSGIERSAC